MKSCYIHIPFCEKICSYCDFCKMYYNEDKVNQYLNELESEIRSTYHNEEIKTLYIGGGTPSCLNIKQLKKLFDIIKIFKKSDDLEFTIECNFSNTSLEKLELFYKYGVNRLSFGIESISKKNLTLLERSEDITTIRSIISSARKVGFNNINVDLMYALPGETVDDLNQDLDFIFDLDIEHISCYSLIIEEHTKLGIKKVLNIDEDLDYEMYEVICKRMKDKGFKHYEISNYAKGNFYSRHNLIYWENEEYFGFGLGTSGFIGNRRYNNTRSLDNYLKGSYLLEEEILEKVDLVYYEIMLNLRKSDGINLDEIYDKYKVRLDYSNLVRKGLLCLEENRLYIPEDKWYISNDIILRLLEGVVYE